MKQNNKYSELEAWKEYAKNKSSLDGQEKGLLHWLEEKFSNKIILNEAELLKKENDILNNKLEVSKSENKNIILDLKFTRNRSKHNWFDGYRVGMKALSPKNKLNGEKQPFVDWLEDLFKADLINSSDIENKKIRIQWVSGGQNGGSCWDDGSEDVHYSIKAEEEPDFDQLDKIIEHICKSEISFLQYKNLCKKLIKYSDYSENEYYGNYTDYNVKNVNLQELYDELKEWK